MVIMACPSCDHTMRRISSSLIKDELAVFWCPRCGTIKTGTNKHQSEERPLLVDQVRVAVVFGELTEDLKDSVWRLQDRAEP